MNKILKIGIVSLALAAAGGGWAASASTAQPVTPMTPNDLVPALAVPQSQSDLEVAKALPASAQSRIEVSTARIAGADELGQYVVATTGNRQEVCVFIRTNTEKHVTGGYCAKLVDFYSSGAFFGIHGSGTGGVNGDLMVYLLPRGVDTTSLTTRQGASFTGISRQANSQILATTNPAALPSRLALQRLCGGPAFEFIGNHSVPPPASVPRS
ncbi:hypothetical protein [Sinomonas sp. P47F7]|uniref:hypothetical protein n=1 Tax=Sinomonas sp. P47F7 TaxID=3410987 RepID=UPI003BF5310E